MACLELVNTKNKFECLLFGGVDKDNILSDAIWRL